MLSCLKVLTRAAAAFRVGDEREGQRILDAVHDCADKDSCASRHICTTAARGISQTRTAGHATPAAAV